MKLKKYLFALVCFFFIVGLTGCQLTDDTKNTEKGSEIKNDKEIDQAKINKILAIINDKNENNNFKLESARYLRETYPNGVVNREVYKISDKQGINYIVKFLEDGRLYEIQSRITTKDLKEIGEISAEQHIFIHNFVLACDMFSQNNKLFDSSKIEKMTEKSLTDLSKKISKNEKAKYTSYASTPERINKDSDYFYIFSFLVDKTSFVVQIDVDLVDKK